MIRVFKKDDIESIMTIWLASNLHAHDFITKDYWLSHYDQVKTMLPQAELYVEEEEERIRGFIGLTDGEYIAGIFVDESFRSQGIGRQLLNWAKQGRERLELNVYEKNNRAVSFYQREGFVIVQQSHEESTGEVEFFMQWERQ